MHLLVARERQERREVPPEQDQDPGQRRVGEPLGHGDAGTEDSSVQRSDHGDTQVGSGLMHKGSIVAGEYEYIMISILTVTLQRTRGGDHPG